jgi:hypothetical protein
VLQLQATEATAHYVRKHMRGLQSVESVPGVHERALAARRLPGLVLELGFFSGQTRYAGPPARSRPEGRHPPLPKAHLSYVLQAGGVIVHLPVCARSVRQRAVTATAVARR